MKKKLKKISIFIGLSILILNVSEACKSNEMTAADNFNEGFLIEKITSHGKIYVIDTSIGEKKYRILTKREIIVNPNCKPIKEGYEYDLKINRLYPPNDNFYAEIDLFSYNNTTIGLRGYGDSLFEAINLRGLCIFNEE